MTRRNLYVVPVSLRDAQAFTEMWHRHHRPPRGHKFAVGAALDGTLIGVAIVGRPVSRHFDQGQTLEVLRVTADGTRNACSLRIITYTQAPELGKSLEAAGFLRVADRRPHAGWDRAGRRRHRADEPVVRTLWEATRTPHPGWDQMARPAEDAARCGVQLELGVS